MPDKSKKQTRGPRANADGWIQEGPDASGFVTGPQPKEDKADGRWHSNGPNAHGWIESSTK